MVATLTLIMRHHQITVHERVEHSFALLVSLRPVRPVCRNCLSGFYVFPPARPEKKGFLGQARLSSSRQVHHHIANSIQQPDAAAGSRRMSVIVRNRWVVEIAGCGGGSSCPPFAGRPVLAGSCCQIPVSKVPVGCTHACSIYGIYSCSTVTRV